MKHAYLEEKEKPSVNLSLYVKKFCNGEVKDITQHSVTTVTVER
jgi:hypothetical protein